MTDEETIRDAMNKVLGAADCSGPKLVFSHSEGRLVLAALDARRAPMTEDEVLQRARRAYCATFQDPGTRQAAMEGRVDNGAVMTAVKHALRDLGKPLVDPVVLACREIVAASKAARGIDSIKYANGERDNSQSMTVAVAAYRAGQAA